jgi:NADPH2:quinone reductase
MVGVYRIHESGGPEVMRWEEEDLGAPAAGMAEVRHTAIGLNYIDTYHRNGLYPLPLPTRLGVEGAGVVAAVGEGVDGIAVGDLPHAAEDPQPRTRHWPAQSGDS